MKKYRFFPQLPILAVLMIFTILFYSCSSSGINKSQQTVNSFISAVRNDDTKSAEKHAPFLADYDDNTKQALITGFKNFFSVNYTIPSTVNTNGIFSVTTAFKQSDGSILNIIFPCQKTENGNWIILSNITSTISYDYIAGSDTNE